MNEVPLAIRQAADVVDLDFDGGYWHGLGGEIGFPYITFNPSPELSEELKRQNLGKIFEQTVAGFCSRCSLNPDSENYQATVFRGDELLCYKFEPIHLDGKGDSYGGADISCAIETGLTLEGRIALSQVIESRAVCLKNEVRTQPHRPLIERTEKN